MSCRLVTGLTFLAIAQIGAAVWTSFEAVFFGLAASVSFFFRKRMTATMMQSKTTAIMTPIGINYTSRATRIG